MKANLFNIDSLPNHSIETLKYQSKTITKSTVNDDVLYSINRDSIFIGASSRELLISSIESAKIHPQLNALIKSSNDDNQLSILINKKHNKDLRSLFINKVIKIAYYMCAFKLYNNFHFK